MKGTILFTIYQFQPQHITKIDDGVQMGREGEINTINHSLCIETKADGIMATPASKPLWLTPYKSSDGTPYEEVYTLHAEVVDDLKNNQPSNNM